MVASLFADPLTLPTVPVTGASEAVVFTGAGGTTFDFVCTGRTANSSTYSHVVSSSVRYDLFIGNQRGKRDRWTVRLTYTELVPSVIDTTVNEFRTSSMYFVVDYPLIGVSTAGGTAMISVGHMLSRWLYDTTDGTPWWIRVKAGET